MVLRRLSEPERILLKKAQISKGKAITVEEGKGILKKKRYRTGRWKYKFYTIGGRTEFSWLPTGRKKRVSPRDVNRAGEFLERLVGLGLMEKVTGTEGEPDKYRLTQDGEKAARTIPFTRPIHREI